MMKIVFESQDELWDFLATKEAIVELSVEKEGQPMPSSVAEGGVKPKKKGSPATPPKKKGKRTCTCSNCGYLGHMAKTCSAKTTITRGKNKEKLWKKNPLAEDADAI